MGEENNSININKKQMWKYSSFFLLGVFLVGGFFVFTGENDASITGGVVSDSDKRCLILKRHEREKAHPGKYGVLGGKLEWEDLPIENPTRINFDILDYEDAVEKLLKKEALEEAGVEIHDDFKYINSVAFIRADEIPVILVKFAAKYKSGEVNPEEGADYAWVNSEEVKNYDCIEGIKEEVKKTIKIFSD